jgi:hypothetical protein
MGNRRLLVRLAASTTGKLTLAHATRRKGALVPAGLKKRLHMRRLAVPVGGQQRRYGRPSRTWSLVRCLGSRAWPVRTMPVPHRETTRATRAGPLRALLGRARCADAREERLRHLRRQFPNGLLGSSAERVHVLVWGPVRRGRAHRVRRSGQGQLPRLCEDRRRDMRGARRRQAWVRCPGGIGMRLGHVHLPGRRGSPVHLGQEGAGSCFVSGAEFLFGRPALNRQGPWL